MPKGATKIILDYKLSRYVCYLIAQNANPRLKNVALAQTSEDISKRKGLKENQQILDYRCSSELGANIFRITQTDELLKNI